MCEQPVRVSMLTYLEGLPWCLAGIIFIVSTISFQFVSMLTNATSTAEADGEVVSVVSIDTYYAHFQVRTFILGYC